MVYFKLKKLHLKKKFSRYIPNILASEIQRPGMKFSEKLSLEKHLLSLVENPLV